MKPYTIKYKMTAAENERFICVLADNKAEAWLAGKDAIRAKEKAFPRSLWVQGVTYQNGNYKKFNTNEKKPY